MTYYIRATNKRGGPIVFSLGVPCGPDEIAGRSKVPPKLVLERGVNKVSTADLVAQPATITDAWDRYVRERVIEVAPWTDADESALGAPTVARPVNEIALSAPRASESHFV